MGSGQDYENTPDYYLKDVNNEFEKFEGEWQYLGVDMSMTLKLKKEEHYQPYPDTKFMDLLVGEYQYIENGVEKVNTLADFNSPQVSGYEHNLSGRGYTRFLPGYCEDNSTPQEIKISLNITKPTNDDNVIEGKLILRYINDNGIEKLEVCIFDYSTTAYEVTDRIDMPDGYYEFVKQ